MINPNDEEELYFAEQEYLRNQENDNVYQEMLNELESIGNSLGLESAVQYLQNLIRIKEKDQK